jgi:hypothetical protein
MIMAFQSIEVAELAGLTKRCAGPPQRASAISSSRNSNEEQRRRATNSTRGLISGEHYKRSMRGCTILERGHSL